MRVLSPILERIVYPVLGGVGYFHSRPYSAALHVITYHGILPDGYDCDDAFLDNTLIGAESFRRQLRLLKKHYSVISPEDFLQWLRGEKALPERAVLLTCDDGLLNHLSVMTPILQKEQLKCLFFITGSSLANAAQMLWYVELYLMLMKAPARETPFTVRATVIPKMSADREERRATWLNLLRSLSRIEAPARRQFMDEAAERLGLQPEWKQRYLDDPLLRSRFQLLRPPELKELSNCGMTIGAHTLTHPVVAQQSNDLARHEITECRSALERVLREPVWALAYPFGDPSSVGGRESELAQQAGYACAFLNSGGGLKSATPRFALPRIHVTANMSLPAYEAHISGFHHTLQSQLRSVPAGS